MQQYFDYFRTTMQQKKQLRGFLQTTV